MDIEVNVHVSSKKTTAVSSSPVFEFHQIRRVLSSLENHASRIDEAGSREW